MSLYSGARGGRHRCGIHCCVNHTVNHKIKKWLSIVVVGLSGRGDGCGGGGESPENKKRKKKNVNVLTNKNKLRL